MAFIRYTQECLDAAQGLWPARGAHEGRLQSERPKTIRVFESRFLEFISQAHPVTPGIWFLPLAAWSLWSGSAGPLGLLRTVGLFLFGVLLWTAVEYALHRSLMHGFLRHADTPARKFRAFMVHGYHHEFADDRMRLVMPPMISWPIAAVVAALWRFAFGPAAWFPIMGGTMTGYVAYDWIHYYTHHARPKTRLGKWLRRYHMRHHFEDENAFYGISSPLWDVVLGTFRRNTPNAAPAKELT